MHVIIFNPLIVIPRFYVMLDLMLGFPSGFLGLQYLQPFIETVF